MRDAATLPWSWYTDPAILTAERRSVLRGWQYVGHTGDLAGPGSYAPVDVGGVPVVVTMDGDGTVRALLNVCRHRGAVVCAGAGSGETLRCPYHAWSYGLDGTLRTAPRSERETHFDPAEHALVELPAGTWGPMLFVAADPEAPPLQTHLADLPERVAAAGVDVEELRFHKRTHVEVKANWKIVAENFLECYHCRVAHPGFSKVIATGPDEFGLDIAPTYSSQYGMVRDNWTGSFDPRGPVPRSQFHLLFPHTAINIFPGWPNLSLGPINPVSPGLTYRFLDYFFAPGIDEDWIAAMMEFDGTVGAEDVALVESVQRGMEAGIVDHGTLFLDSEHLIAHFNEWLRDRVGQPQ